MLSVTLILAIIVGAIAGFACLCLLAEELAHYIRVNTQQQHRNVGYVEVDRYSECEKGCVESVAFLNTSEKSEMQNVESVALLDTSKDKSGDTITRKERTTFHDDRIIEVSKTHELAYMDEFENLASSTTSLLPPTYNDLLSESRARMSCSEEWQSVKTAAPHTKRSTYMSELEGVDFGSMGTKGIRVVRGDGEMDDEEEY
jgi:hypothetical protein